MRGESLRMLLLPAHAMPISIKTRTSRKGNSRGNQTRINVGVVARLAEVDLDGCEVALFYDFGESCGVK